MSAHNGWNGWNGGHDGKNGHGDRSCDNNLCPINGGVIAPGEAREHVGGELYHLGCYQLWQAVVAKRTGMSPREQRRMRCFASLSGLAP